MDYRMGWSHQGAALLYGQRLLDQVHANSGRKFARGAGHYLTGNSETAMGLRQGLFVRCVDGVAHFKQHLFGRTLEVKNSNEG